MSDPYEKLYIEAVAAQFNLDAAELENYCNRGYIPYYQHNGRKVIRQQEKLVLAAAHPRLKDSIIILPDSFMYESHPELIEYLSFHGILDILGWLIKLRYSPRETVKRKAYTLPGLFDAFLQVQRFDLVKIRRLVGTDSSEDKFKFHLNKGWYNELARSYPLDAETLKIGTQTSPEHSVGKPLAWNITQSYYSVYEYINALVFTNSKDLRTEEHRKSTRHFNATLLPKFSGRLIPYPFNLTNPVSQDVAALRGADEKFWNTAYARYPRDTSRSIYHLEQDFVGLLAGSKDIPSFLYSFRVWANYLGIDTIIELEDGYFLSHLYKNMSILCFFYGCFAEVMALAFLGVDKTAELLERLAFQYVLKQDNFKKNWLLVPMFIRFRLYQKHGLFNKRLDFLDPSYLDPLADL